MILKLTELKPILPIKYKRVPIRRREVPIKYKRVPIRRREVPIKQKRSADKAQGSADKLQHKLVLEYVEKNGKITSRQAEELLNVKQRRAREVLSKMVDKETLMKETGGNHHPSVRRRTEGGTSGHREQYIKYV